MRSLYLDRRVRSLPSKCRVVDVPPLVRRLIRAVSALPAEYDERGPEGRLGASCSTSFGVPEVAFSLPMPSDPRLSRIAESLEASAGRGEDARQSGPAWRARRSRTLARLFRRETGLPFGEWRRRLRLLASLSALEGGASVTAVALDSGYDSPSAFIAAFRRLFGGTPTEFVRER